METFFGRFESKLPEWNSQGVTYSADKDLRRIFIKSELRIEDYVIITCIITVSCFTILQTNTESNGITKKLAELIDNNENSESKYEDEGDRLIIEKLNELGFKDMPKQELFELFYNDEELAMRVKKMIDDSQPKVVDIQNQKNQLLRI